MTHCQVRCDAAVGDAGGWDACWAAACARVVPPEVGCATSGDCATPFERVLLQTRNPLMQIASLVCKFCPAAADAQGGRCRGHGAAPPLVAVEPVETCCAEARALFGALFPTAHYGYDFDELPSCVAVMAAYWVAYNGAMRRHADAAFAVERATPCEVAALGGLPGAARCDQRAPADTTKNGAAQLGQNNLGGFTVTSADMRAGCGADLSAAVAALAADFGYDYDLEVV